MKANVIINDPVYGFITLHGSVVREIIQHPWIQRLRFIKQLGMTDFVYPAATHTRFQHALGAYHLMGQALTILRSKGIEISPEEFEAAQLAVLMHDLGHGPFSHALEATLMREVHHESVSFLMMEQLNDYFDGALNLALRMFRDSYDRKFFHQLISSQLDIDRLDYLTRDCFFTGVKEGVVGVDRILQILTVVDDELVVEQKGIYSIENFLNSRRQMYWQVYLHKTTVSAEQMMINLIRRAQYLVQSSESLPCSKSLRFFLETNITLEEFKNNPEAMDAFGTLEDHDIWGALKMWQHGTDKILATLSKMLLTRDLFRITLDKEPIAREQIATIREAVKSYYHSGSSETPYLFSYGTVSNEAYAEGKPIKILTPSGEKVDLALASDLPAIQALTKIVKKNYLCWPRALGQI